MLAISSIGQTTVYHPFPESNAYWNISSYTICNMGSGEFSEYSIMFSGDTIINSTIYHKLRTPFVNTYPTNICGSPLTGYKGAIRQDIANKKVFYISPGYSTEEILYDFNMNIGDTVKGFLHSPDFGYDTVSDIDSVIVGSSYHKRLKINSDYLIYLIEGFGSTFGLIEPSPGHITDAVVHSISCYNQNGATQFPDSNSNCQLITTVSEDPDISSQVIVFPNPSNGSFRVDFSNMRNLKEILLQDLLGKIVFRQTINNQRQIKIDNLPSGAYILTIIDNDNIKINKKIISSP